MEYMENNKALVVGTVVTNPTYSHSSFGEDFFTFEVATKRDSGVEDLIPCMVSNRLVDTSVDIVGSMVRVSGTFRSRNIHTEERSKLVLNLFAHEFEVVEDDLIDVNTIKLCGYICKPPIFRQTPKGRLICDFLLAVNYDNGKSAYIPCIAWGRNARFVESHVVGDYLELLGRMQSREYLKVYEDGTEVVKTAYEISVQLVED